ncbi:hypothetical protein QBC46DRAFT_348486 [Diplogelasinospora grovesii]|uniref:Uncharacterized protein n=1 Tax=Diplogelasinospora grovesii TaxID=303347 RepID=A0AAN6MW01_9PEZI|nr:hypothetical protein QBC46DRAFT_348486 [Diplogelasinospora grovesii]
MSTYNLTLDGPDRLHILYNRSQYRQHRRIPPWIIRQIPIGGWWPVFWLVVAMAGVTFVVWLYFWLYLQLFIFLAVRRRIGEEQERRRRE